MLPPEPRALSAGPLPPPRAPRSEPTYLLEALAPLPSRPLVPVANVVAPAPSSQALAPRSEEVPSPAWPSLPESSRSQDRWPWPELPEPPVSESPEGAALLLHWERLLRLDREQRGE